MCTDGNERVGEAARRGRRRSVRTSQQGTMHGFATSRSDDPRVASIGFYHAERAEVQTRAAEKSKLLVYADIAMWAQMLIVGLVRRWELARSPRYPVGIKACSRWSSAANTTGSCPPTRRTLKGCHISTLGCKRDACGPIDRAAQVLGAVKGSIRTLRTEARRWHYNATW
jgi:hypothetical protein